MLDIDKARKKKKRSEKSKSIFKVLNLLLINK